MTVVAQSFDQLWDLIKDPARFEWNEACLARPRRSQDTNVAHYYLSVDAMTRPM